MMTHKKIRDYFFLTFRPTLGKNIVLINENGRYYTGIFSQSYGIEKIEKTDCTLIEGLNAQEFYEEMKMMVEQINKKQI